MRKLLKPLASLIAATTLAGTAWAANWGYHGTDRSWTVIKIGDVSMPYSLDGSGSPAFQNADLGTIVQGDSLTIVKYDTKTWKNEGAGGNVTGCEYTYAIDGGTAVSMGGTWVKSLGWDGSSENQLWGRNSECDQYSSSTDVNAVIDTTGLTPGRHTLTIYGEISGGNDPAGPISDGPYTAGFVVSAGGGGGTVVTTNTVKYTVATKDSVTVTGTAPTGSSPTYEQSYNTAGQATSNKYLRLTLSGYAGKTITGLTLSMKSNAKAGRGSLDVTCGDATIAAIANSTFSNGWYSTYSSSYVDITPTVTPTVIDNNDVVIEINCTWNSLYCQSYEVTYTEGQTAPTDFSVALALSADEVELGTEATVTATPQNAAEGRVTYEWTIDDVAAGGSGYVLSLATGVADTHTVKCIATDANGAKATNTVTYTVYAMYNVTVDPDIQHGTVTVDPVRARVGATVTVNAAGDLGYAVDTLTYSYNGGEPIAIENGAFTMPAADVTVSATFAEVIDYTHLPFEHDTTWKNAQVVGLTVSGCGSDYSSGDGAKLDAAGAYVQVKFAETPSQLVYTIKANGSTTAAFDFEVQESDTGASWTPLASFTDDGTAIPSSETTYTNALSATTRVVRFIHVTKGTGQNVGLYYVKIEAEVPATKYAVTVDDSIVHGTVTVDKAEAAAGATVNVTATSDRGYALDTLKYNGTDIVNGSFTMPAADVEVTATFTAVPVYKRVESADDFVTGAKYLVVAYKDGNNGYTSALKNVATANDQISVDETISIEFADDGKFISVDDPSIVWQILHTSSVAGEYVLFNEDERVYAAALNNGNKAQLLSADDGNLAQWTFDFEDVPAVKMYSLAYPSRWLQRNGTANNKFFATYDTTGTEPWLFIDTTTDAQTVYFDWNDGSGTVTSMKYVKGDQYPWFEKPVSSGGVFQGWFDAPADGNRVMLGAVTDDDERTLYAYWENNQTVKFNPNGGTCETASLDFAFGGTYSGFPTPVWAGHDFQGWFTASGAEVADGDEVIYSTSLALYAHWSGQDVQMVTCDANGGTCNPTTVMCGIGATYPTFPTPKWKGHAFLGWYDSAEDGNPVMGGMKVTAVATRTIYAHWTSTQTVSFAPNGGTCGTASIQCQMGGAYPALPVPTWSGHAFLGWFTEAGGGLSVAAGDIVTTASSRVLYAHWEGQSSQVVTFNANGGTCAKSLMTVAIGSTYPTFPTPKWTGHVFLGWFDSAEGGNNVTGGMKVPNVAARTVYAHWTSTQTVRFAPNGGTCGTVSIQCAIGGTYPVLPVPTWSDHTFLGWFSEAVGGTPVAAGDVVPAESSRVLFAQWEGQSAQIVTLNANGGTCTKATITAAIGSTYPTFPTPKWADHVFLGWFDAVEDGNNVTGGMVVPDVTARTVYAHWTSSQTLRFSPNGGTCETASIQCAMGGVYPALPNPTWSDHTFLGWFTEAVGGTLVATGDTVTLESTRFLYAQWEGQSAQVVEFNANGGTCPKASITAAIGSTYPTFPTPKWPGHTFKGWFTEAEEGTRVSGGMTVTDDEKRTLFAHWQEGTVSISGISMSSPTASSTRRGLEATTECTLSFETIADVAYEVQWTSSLGGEWTVLKRWVATEDGEAAVTVAVLSDSSVGFFRLVQAGVE